MMEIGREVKLVEFINTDVWGIEHALRWCHNLQNTWARSDSGLCKGGDDGIGCVHCAIRQRCSHFYNREFVLGIRDMELMQGLIWAGGEEAEFLRMIHVAVDLVTDMGEEAEWKKDAAGKMGDGAVCVTWNTNTQNCGNFTNRLESMWTGMFRRSPSKNGLNRFHTAGS